jgi:tryptophan 2,3-dioxygenase
MPAPYYNDYLHLDKILEAQYPYSAEPGNQLAHDEMLFIIIHQAYELWFKQIHYELDYIVGVFRKEKIDDNSEDLNLVNHRLHRITKIYELLNQQVHILDTMTPLDFLEFRNLLTPSSGFQSLQFRLIEARLGLALTNRHQHDYYKRTGEGGFTEQHFHEINTVEKEPTLLQLLNRWLERMPFFEERYWLDMEDATGGHPFWQRYRHIYQQSLTEKENDKMSGFDYVFFGKADALTTEQQLALRSTLSSQAVQAALFIMLYRDFPVFQTSYQILDNLIDLDHLMATWRHKHLVMVRRMIGMRVGTGNTSGAGYLEGALNRHYIFRDLASLSTYLIERRKLPKLPQALIRHLSYNV